VPLAQLPATAATLPRDRMLVVLCHHGMRSAQATSWLRRQGFDKAVNLAGGIDAWAREIDPAVPTY
jgi:rhodanese-related sulfurtransferase